MSRKPLATSLLTAIAFCGAARGQTHSVTLPANLGSGAEGSSAASTMFSATGTGVRQQLVYDEASLPQGRLRIVGLRFRHNGGTIVTPGGIWTGATIAMCTSANPVESVSATFASNLSGDLTTVFSGTIAVAATSVSYPGQYYVDLTLATPFVYQRAGDLLIDVRLPNGGWTGGATATTDYHVPQGTPAARIFTTNPASATGTIDAGSGIVCELVYTVDPQSARTSVTGEGCYDSMFYEHFAAAPSCDLSNTALRMQPNAHGGYDVRPIPLNYIAPTSPPLTPTSGTLDDGLVLCPLPFAFHYPGGIANSVQLASNGFIWLDSSQTSPDFSSSTSELLSLAPRLAVAWADWNADPTTASGGGSLHLDVDTSNQVARLSWHGVGAYGWTAAFGGPVFSTFQCQLFANGTIEFHYAVVDNRYPLRDLVVGVKPDSALHADPGEVDLTSITSIATTAGSSTGLRLNTAALPVLGSSFAFRTTNVPINGLLGGTVLALGADPGTDLGLIGMPGCRRYVDTSSSSTLALFAIPGSGVIAYPIPNNAAFIGVTIYGQSFVAIPGVNTLGALASNGVSLRVGSF